jgi:putative addiction module component (TIGR02574 family)
MSSAQGDHMSSLTENLLHDALALPEEDRFELVEALIASFQSEHHPPFDESWREIIYRRSAELRSGKVSAVPWEEVKQRAREKASG